MIKTMLLVFMQMLFAVGINNIGRHANDAETTICIPFFVSIKYFVIILVIIFEIFSISFCKFTVIINVS